MHTTHRHGATHMSALGIGMRVARGAHLGAEAAKHVLSCMLVCRIGKTPELVAVAVVVVDVGIGVVVVGATALRLSWWASCAQPDG